MYPIPSWSSRHSFLFYYTTLLVIVGGIIKKPGVINDKIKIREYLQTTITTDHDIIDGGPLTRFVDRFDELIENSFGLME